jgi:hypothetical protein
VINKFTSEQEAKIDEYYQHYLALGRSTKPIDKEKVSEGVDLYYKAINKSAPTKLWFSSPMMCELAIHVLKKVEPKKFDSQLWSQLESQLSSQLWSQLGSQLGSQLSSQLGSQLWSQLESQLDSQLWSQLWSQLGSQLRSQLDSQLWSQLDSQLRSQLWSQLGSQLGSQLDSQLRLKLWSQLGSQLDSQLRLKLWSQLEYISADRWGCYDGNWICYYSYAHEVLGFIDDGNGINKELLKAAQLCCYGNWMWFFDGLVIMSDHPRQLLLDERGRLHGENDMAMKFSDGWGIWAWHGARVPEDIITRPESITIEAIDKEENQEIRSVMLERFGAERYILEGDAKQVSKDEYGVLYKKAWKNGEYVMVQVLNSTLEPTGERKKYFLRVPPEIKTAKEAVAWTFYQKPEEYNPRVET